MDPSSSIRNIWIYLLVLIIAFNHGYSQLPSTISILTNSTFEIQITNTTLPQQWGDTTIIPTSDNTTLPPQIMTSTVPSNNSQNTTQKNGSLQQEQVSGSIINEELDKLEHSGYLFFPHIYRAFIRAGKTPEHYNMSSTCAQNMAAYYRGLNLKEGWAWNMYDSTGKQRAGILTGALTWAGNYQQCIDALGYHNNLKEFQSGPSIPAQYCSVYISTPSWVKDLVDKLELPFPPPHPPFIADVCVVSGCSTRDISNIVQKFVIEESWLGNYTVSLVKCQAQLDLSQDPGAIITLFVVSLILLLVALGTTYEIYLRSRRRGVRSSRDIHVGEESDLDTSSQHRASIATNGSEPPLTGYTNQAFHSDETDIDHHEDGKENGHANHVTMSGSTKGVQFESDVKIGLSNIPEKGESSDKIVLMDETPSTTSSRNALVDMNDTNEASEGGEATSVNESHEDKDPAIAAHSRGRRVSERFNELMSRSAARIKRSFKRKSSGSGLPRMQKRHLQTQLSLIEPDKTKRGVVQLMKKCLVCFSLRRNFTNVLGKGHLDTMFCINGIRVMSIGWIVLGSYYSAFYSNPSYVDNHLDAVKLTQSFWIQAMINTTFAADTFFVLSGTLYAFNFMKQKSKQKSKKFHQIMTPLEYVLTVVHRLARIVPCYYFVLMVYTNLGPYMFVGAEFRSGLKSNTQCTDHWWANLLFISNFYMSDKMCMPWTYYLVNDFQFSLLSPLVVIPLLCYPFIGFAIVLALIALQIISVSVLNVGINGSVMRMGNTDYFSSIYVKPYCRVAPYAIGLALGYILFTTGRKAPLRKVPLVIGWIVCLALVAILPYITFTENRVNGHKWTDIERSIFEAFSRPCWGLCVAWVIYVCCNGQGGFISKLLSWNFFIPLCRITYGVYLIHPIFIEIILTSSHYNFFITFGEVTYGYISVMVSCWIIALFFMASVEQPFIGALNLIISYFHGNKK